MTIREFAEQLSTTYQHDRMFEKPVGPNSLQKNAVMELKRAAAALVHDPSTKNKHAVEGAIYLCGSMTVFTEKEVEKLTKELYEAK